MSIESTEIYSVTEWKNYARLFFSIMTSVQLEVYKEASQHLHGDVADFGCGAAKIAPFLADNELVSSYAGIDYADDMVDVARELIDHLKKTSFNIQLGKIEDTEGCFTSAVSIQSYYSWPDPMRPLRRIYDVLPEGGIFVLGTPNPSLDLESLAKDLEKELIGHPFLDAYKSYNLELAANTNAQFIEMGDLIDNLHSVGFKVVEAHQRHFQGGLNFIVLKK